jgi:dethiobiotin synthetase
VSGRARLTVPDRPPHLVVITGTGTEVGKTWWGAAAARVLVARGVHVAARKPVQSFAPDDPLTDADVLAQATGDDPRAVCPPHRWIAKPLAPPMAAAALGQPGFTIGDLANEIEWPPGTAVGLGLVEGAGGVRSPLADDGDTVALIRVVAPDEVLVVADAGLGTINAVRLTLAAFTPTPVVVALNRFAPTDDVHRANREWLATRDGLTVVTSPDELAARWV